MSSPNKSLMVWGILPTPLQPRGEDPETVEMGDVEIVHPGSVGDELLREVIETWGWMGQRLFQHTELEHSPSNLYQKPKEGMFFIIGLGDCLGVL